MSAPKLAGPLDRSRRKISLEIAEAIEAKFGKFGKREWDNDEVAREIAVRLPLTHLEAQEQWDALDKDDKPDRAAAPLKSALSQLRETLGLKPDASYTETFALAVHRIRAIADVYEECAVIADAVKAKEKQHIDNYAKQVESAGGTMGRLSRIQSSGR